MGHWPKLYRLFPTLIVCSSGSIMFGLVGKYIGNKETKGCHKRWLKLWLKDRGGEALSYDCFSDCVIVSVTELLVRLVEWSQASGKHLSMRGGVINPWSRGWLHYLCLQAREITASWHQQVTQSPNNKCFVLQNLFKSRLMCQGCTQQTRCWGATRCQFICERGRMWSKFWLLVALSEK